MIFPLRCGDFFPHKPGFLPPGCCGSCHDDEEEFNMDLTDHQPPALSGNRRPYRGRYEGPWAEVCCAHAGAMEAMDRTAWARAILSKRKQSK